jgi:uncharacterized membrane protein
MSISVAWLTTVVATWLVTLPLLAFLIKVPLHQTSARGLAGMAVVSATFARVVVGGSASAVALRVLRKHGQRRAALSGLATAGVVLLFFYSYVAATGAHLAAAWKALLPLVIVTAAELAVALRLRRYCCKDQPPGPTPPDQTPSSPTPPDQPEAAA